MASKRFGPRIIGERAVMVEEEPNVFLMEQQHSKRKDDREERKRAEREEQRLKMETKQKEESGRHNLNDVCSSCHRNEINEGESRRSGRIAQDRCYLCPVRVRRDGDREAYHQSFGFQARQVAQKRPEIGVAVNSSSPENQLRRQLRNNRG